MTVLRESPWYEEILAEGEGRGELKGELRGKLKGEQSLVLRLLARRIGEVSPDLTAQVQALSLDQIESLGEALLDFSAPQDLIEWLQAH